MSTTPQPRETETLSDWMTRCMDDQRMKDSYPNESERKAQCQALWNIALTDRLEFNCTDAIVRAWQNDGGMFET